MRRLPPLLLLLAATLLATAAEAQIVRPSESVYLSLRGGVTGYYGDLQTTASGGLLDQATDGFDNPGFGVGGEIGYQFNPNLSLGLGFLYHDVPSLNNPATNVQGGEAYQGQLLFRYLPFASARITPYLEAGAALVAGQGTENERGGAGTDDVLGYGPVVGLGVDVALTPQFGLFLGAQSTFVFPDVALDGRDEGGRVGDPADDYDFDALATLGGGLRYAFRAPVTAVTLQGLECPAELEAGEEGAFAVYTNDDASLPVSARWDWGDGRTASGLTARHAYAAPGTYTVTATASNDGGTDAESCLVTVVEPPVPPTIAGCRATPASTTTGEAVSFSATVAEADEVTVDFGDGTRGSALPALHTYDRAGTYTATLSVTNAFGSDACTVTVTVADPAPTCGTTVDELNPVFFDYGSSALSASARSRLDENVELLRRCADVCVTINGYSDGAEPVDASRIAMARAEAVRAYYVSQGLDADRFEAVGRGVAPGANSKEDPGPGDARARRADSIPSSCAGF